MPQMAPIMWTFLYLDFLVVFTVLALKLYFIMIKFMSSSKIFNSNFKSPMWEW